MMEMLDSSIGEDQLETKVLLNVACSRSISVGRLDNTNVELVEKARLTCEMADKGSGQGSNAVAVQKTEDIVLVAEVEDDTIGITIKGAAAVQGGGLGGRRSTLVGLDKVGPALIGVVLV